MTPAQRYHAWTFELYGDAEVDVSTARALRDSEDVDTVLYLYRQSASGSWGRYLSRNDNASAATTWSAIARSSRAAGKYLVLVKGRHDDDVGRFGVKVRCAGDGCRRAGAPWLGLTSCQADGCTIPPTWEPITALDEAWRLARAELDEHVDMTYAELFLVGIQFGREEPIPADRATPDDFEWYFTFFTPFEHPAPGELPGWIALVGVNRHEIDTYEDGYGAPTYKLIERQAALGGITKTFADVLAAHAASSDAFSIDRGGLARTGSQPEFFVSNTRSGDVDYFSAR